MVLFGYVFAFIMGSVVGSFLNVCIYRLPRGLSLLSPPSHCAWCNEPVRWHDNIPVLSYIALGGRCRHCGTAFSPRYALVEAMTGLVFVYIAHHYFLRPELLFAAERPAFAPVFWQMLVGTVLCSALIVVSMIDIERRIIPDEITKSGMIVGPLLSLVYPGLHGIVLPGLENITDPLLRLIAGTLHIGGSPRLCALAASLLGMIAAGGFIFLTGQIGTKVFRKDAMGFGDVKLMLMMGSFLGWRAGLAAIMISCIYGAVVGIAIWFVKRDSRIPFGPYLSLGCVTVMFFAPEMLRLYDWWAQMVTASASTS